jgi:Cys-tRNA(Pro)/Cys-tRNA(Cys) deacylase
MTPAINLLKKHNIAHQIHEYTHDAASESYGLEAAAKMDVPEARVFKTLVLSLNNNQLAVAILPVSSQLGMKLMAKAVGAKSATMADKDVVERSTGYVLGGVSPLGQKKHLKTVIDQSAEAHTTIFISAGRRGLEIELNSEDLKKLTSATLADICQNN